MIDNKLIIGLTPLIKEYDFLLTKHTLINKYVKIHFDRSKIIFFGNTLLKNLLR